MRLKTKMLQKLANLAISGCGQNSQIPITQLFGIKTFVLDDKNYLVICSTDTINYIYVTDEIDSDEPIDVCVNANVFTQLMNKFTTDNVEITLADKYISIIADGEYKLEISLLDNGEVQKFPLSANKTFEAYSEPIEIEVEKFRRLKAFGEDALATMENEVDLNGYFIGNDLTISTNRKIMVVNKDEMKLFTVLRRKFVDLICQSEDKTVNVYELTNKDLLVVDTLMNIYSTINSPVENYPYEQIKKLINNDNCSFKCKINKKELINILDRISLVVTKYDSNVIELAVSEGILLVSSIKSTGNEYVELESVNEETPLNLDFVWTGRINCDWLKTQLATFDKDEIELQLGNDKCIKLVQGDVTKLISLA